MSALSHVLGLAHRVTNTAMNMTSGSWRIQDDNGDGLKSAIEMLESAMIGYGEHRQTVWGWHAVLDVELRHHDCWSQDVTPHRDQYMGAMDVSLVHYLLDTYCIQYTFGLSTETHCIGQ